MSNPSASNTNPQNSTGMPEKILYLPTGRQEGAQYKLILHCREAPACLSRPNGMAREFHKSLLDVFGEEVSKAGYMRCRPFTWAHGVRAWG